MNNFDNQNEIKRKGESLMYENKEKFTLGAMADKLDILLEKYIPNQVQIQLPKLKKVKNDQPSQIELPKLKRV